MMSQLILHLVGDYVTQSQWMAENKTKRFWPAWAHALVYSLPFLLIGSEAAWLVILWSHFLIDRYSLAKYVVYAKNRVLDPWSLENPSDYFFMPSVEHQKQKQEHIIRWKWSNCSATGYPSDMPPWLSVWLLIAADNVLHLTINYAALRWL